MSFHFFKDNNTGLQRIYQRYFHIHIMINNQRTILVDFTVELPYESKPTDYIVRNHEFTSPRNRENINENVMLTNIDETTIFTSKIMCK